MSSNGETTTVLRGVTHGAVDFLIKPVRIEELRNVWQHVVRRKRELVGYICSVHVVVGGRFLPTSSCRPGMWTVKTRAKRRRSLWMPPERGRI